MICGGGGGRYPSSKKIVIFGVPAVIDKDRLSALIAIKLNADALIISTAVDSVKPVLLLWKVSHRKLTLDECEAFFEQGEFLRVYGSKDWKFDGSIASQPFTNRNFVSTGDTLKSLRGEAGTTIVVK